MALPTLAVLDKDSLPVTVSTLRSGRAAAADSSGVALATEDKAALDAIEVATEALQAAIATFGAVQAERSVLYSAAGAAVDFTSGTAGTPAGGVSSIQGVTGMVPVDVTQTTVGYDVQTSVTRPANVTAYTAGDVVGGAIDLGVLGPSAKAVMITSAQLQLDIAAVPSGMTTFTLYLYSVTPPSAIADNSAFDLASGDRASYLGSISLGTPADLVSTLYIETNSINKQVKLAGTHLFGYLVTTAGYTPAAISEVYRVTLHTVAV